MSATSTFNPSKMCIRDRTKRVRPPLCIVFREHGDPIAFSLLQDRIGTEGDAGSTELTRRSRRITKLIDRPIGKYQVSQSKERGGLARHEPSQARHLGSSSGLVAIFAHNLTLQPSDLPIDKPIEREGALTKRICHIGSFLYYVLLA